MSVAESELILQVFTGGFATMAFSAEAIIAKIREVHQRREISKVIIGWSTAFEDYLPVLAFLKQQGIESYLWLPVFSEIELLASVKRIRSFQEEVREYVLSEEEKFSFYCPNTDGNITSFKGIYQKYFQKLPFDGVFLDKIRYPSLAHGIEGLFSCFCPTCQKSYQEAGLDITALKAAYQQSKTGRAAENGEPAVIKQDPVLTDFLDFRMKVISRRMEELVTDFHQQGRKVGLDTFAPSLAPLVGQDLKKLAELADFIKPMMYFNVGAPAGIPFEYQQLYQSFGLQRDLAYIDQKAFMEEEYAALAEISGQVFPGIPANRIGEIAEITPKMVQEAVQLAKHYGAGGIVLSWNVMEMPAENLSAALEVID